ncbi:DUF99 family protein [Desulfurococcaceae archaeon MEX13E-LK6-19]|nr:DUF99 family protein [Desulfurococcaceae archaeon MEX13E-LK6-19]
MEVIAIDDGYFPLEYKARRGYTILFGVLYSIPTNAIEAFSWNYIEVDGLDATDKAIEIVRLLKRNENIVLLDGVTYGGFNIIDPRRIYSETKTPCIVVFRYPLSIERIRKALTKNFSDYKIRLEVIEYALTRRYVMETPWRALEYTPVGISPYEAKTVLEKLQFYSPEPEPLRIADQLASILSREMLRIGML